MLFLNQIQIIQIKKKNRIKESTEDKLNEGCRFQPRCPYAIDKCSIDPKLIEKNQDHFVSCHVEID